jgi:hypothetical protein
MEQINTCDILFCGGGEKNLMFFFLPEKPKMFDGRSTIIAPAPRSLLELLVK